MTEFDLKNWLQTTSVGWELSLPGLNFWLGNTLAYIILHLQKFAVSAVQTATCREENSQREGQPGWLDVLVVRALQGGVSMALRLDSSSRGAPYLPVLLCSAPSSRRKGHTQGTSNSLLEAVQ